MTLIAEIGILGFKIESVPGVAETITGSDCKLLVEEVSFVPEPVSVEQPVVKPKMGRIQQRPGGRSMTISFKVGVKGSGTPGTQPAIGDLLKACQFTEVVRAGVGCWYTSGTLSVASQPTLTLYFNNDGRYCIGKGCMGTVNFTGANNEIHYAEFEFRGVFESEGDAAMLVPSLEQTHPDVLLQTGLALLEYHSSSTRIQTVAGSEDLLQAAAVNASLAAVLDNTGGGATQIGRLRPYLKRTGVPAGYTNGIRMSIFADAAGLPTGAALASSDWLDPLYLRDDAHDFVTFTFSTPYTLSAATKYHAVLEGDFTPGANIIDWGYYAVAATTSSTYTAGSWAALGSNNDFIIDICVAPLVCLHFASAGFDLANTVNLRQDISCSAEGWDRAFISARAPLASLEPEQEKIADRDFLTYHKNATPLFMGYHVGSLAGSKVTFEFQHSQIISVGEPGDRDGATTCPLEIQPCSGLPVTTGDDDVIIKFQ